MNCRGTPILPPIRTCLTPGHSTNAVDRFLAQCTICDDGFASTGLAEIWRMGLVAEIGRGSEVVLVRKAPDHRPGYEFGAMWALPGGAVRGPPASNVAAAAATSLHDRLLAETGVPSAELVDRGLSDELGPLISSYTTATGRRHTVIAVRRYLDHQAHMLEPSDPSISHAAWTKLPPVWSTLAPANRVAIAHLHWRSLKPGQRSAGKPAIEEAVGLCSCWAAEIGLPAIPAPWATEAELADWRTEWSRLAERRRVRRP